MNKANIYFLMSIQVLIAGGTHIVAKAVVTDIDTGPLLFMRSIISSCALLAVYTMRYGRLKIERKDWGSIAWLGFLGVLSNQFLYLYGMKFTTAANGALLYAFTPVLVLILSHFILKEKITPKKSLGIFLAFAGIAIVIFEKGVDFSSGYAYGNLMILIAVLAWALFTIMGKAMIVKYGALQTTTAMLIAGAILYLPAGIYSAVQFPFSNMTGLHWGGVLYLSIGTSVLGYVLWYHALGRIETSKAAVFANGQPIIATILSYFFLNYSITGDFVLGGIMTVAGVIITQLG